MKKQDLKPRIIYSEQLGNIVRKNNYIPRRINDKIYLKLYHRYYCNHTDSYFKVRDIYMIDDKYKYYSVNYINSMNAELCGPCYVDYELLSDFRNVKDKDIINSGVAYYGSEIRYWFFINNINLNSPKYSEFWSFINPNNKRNISDDKMYFVNAKYIDGIYKNCTIISSNKETN